MSTTAGRFGHVGGRVRPLAPVALVTGLVIGLSGCGVVGIVTPGSTLPPDTRMVEVTVGEKAQIGLGSVNTSVGDNWGAVSQQPSGIVEAEFVTGTRVMGHREPLGKEHETGASTDGAIQFTGLKSGTTTVRITYCFRDVIREGCDRGYSSNETNQPFTVTVRVR